MTDDPPKKPIPLMIDALTDPQKRRERFNAPVPIPEHPNHETAYPTKDQPRQETYAPIH